VPDPGLNRRALFTLGLSRLRKDLPDDPPPARQRPKASATERLILALEEADLHWVTTKPALALFERAAPAAGEQVLVVAADALDDAFEGRDALVAVADGGEVADLPFDDAEFDRVYVTYAHAFWPEPTDAIAEVFRVVRPGGTAAFVSWTDAGTVGRLMQASIDWDPGLPPPQTWGLDERMSLELETHGDHVEIDHLDVEADYDSPERAAAALERALPPLRAALAGFPGADGNGLRAHAVRLVQQEAPQQVTGRVLLALARKRA
jgi:SAM-dependent methyltransferase